MAGPLSGEPLTAALLKAKLITPPAQLGALDKFFKAVCRGVEQELQGFHATPVKVSVAGAGIEILAAGRQKDHAFRFACGADTLRLWCECDKDFDSLLSELCLGGTGLAATGTPEERPPSKFERKLKAAVIGQIIASLPEAARLAHGVTWDEAAPPGEAEALAEPGPETCVGVRLLVNAFTLAGEISIFFQRAVIEKSLHVVLGNDIGDGMPVRPALEKCPFELEVYLKPQLIGLDRVLAMREGELIPLHVHMSSPVSVHFEHTHVFDATVSFNKEAINVVLADELPAQMLS